MSRGVLAGERRVPYGRRAYYLAPGNTGKQPYGPARRLQEQHQQQRPGLTTSSKISKMNRITSAGASTKHFESDLPMLLVGRLRLHCC